MSPMDFRRPDDDAPRPLQCICGQPIYRTPARTLDAHTLGPWDTRDGHRLTLREAIRARGSNGRAEHQCTGPQDVQGALFP